MIKLTFVGSPVLRRCCGALVGTVMFLLALPVGTAQTTTTTTASSTTSSTVVRAPRRNTSVLRSGFLLGVFSGGFNPRSAEAYESWLGRRSDFNVEFLTETAFTNYIGDTGINITDSLAASTGWVLSVWSGANRPDRNMMFSVPLATKQDGTLANVAAGKYDTQYRDVAKIIAARYPGAIIRIGWEFNADWYAWSAMGRAQDYVAAYRRVANIFKSASSDFTIDWCPVQGFSAKMPAADAYPGDDVVDVISMDVYNDYRWGDYKDDPIKRWEWMKNFKNGLLWQKDFATAHKKPMGIPEWGVNKDDPYFIEKMHEWIRTNDFAYVAYWDSNSAFKGMLSRNQYPQAAATYKRLFGSMSSKQGM